MPMNDEISFKTRVINVGKYKMGGKHPIILFAGPNVIEPLEVCLEIARYMKKVADNFGFTVKAKESRSPPEAVAFSLRK